jgi:hypothetical protein
VVVCLGYAAAGKDVRMSDGPVVRIASSPDGIELYVLVDGKRIAKRGQPGTPQAGTWISLEPGWEVVSGKDHKTIGIRYNGVSAQ